MNKHLIVPDTLNVFNDCKSKANIFDAQIKIATFINGECSSCLGRLQQWDDFVEKNRLNNCKNFSLLIYINARNYTQVEFFLNEVNFNYPVIFDPNNLFYSLNSLSNNIHFQTFLLDRNNYVIAIGNPLVNKRIAREYIKIITDQ